MVRNDVEQAQEPSVDPARGRRDAGEEREGHVPSGSRAAVAFGFGASHAVQSSVGFSIAELAIPAYIRLVIAPEFVDHSYVDNDVFVAAQLDILEPCCLFLWCHRL